MLQKTTFASLLGSAGIDILPHNKVEIYKIVQMIEHRSWLYRKLHAMNPLFPSLLDTASRWVYLFAGICLTLFIAGAVVGAANVYPISGLAMVSLFSAGALLIICGSLLDYAYLKGRIYQWSYVPLQEYRERIGEVPPRALELIKNVRALDSDAVFEVAVLGDDPILYVRQKWEGKDSYSSKHALTIWGAHGEEVLL